MGDFFYFILSYDRDKKNEREYRVQDGEPADTNQRLMRLFSVLFYFKEG